MSYTNAPHNASYAPRPASEKQTAFLKTLLTERQIDETLAATVGARLAANALTSREASAYIGDFLAAARKPIPLTVVDNPLGLLLMNIPVSRYAIPVKDVDTLLTGTNTYDNDTIFAAVEKGRYGASKGRLFLNRLSGGVGGFVRRRFDGDDALTIARYLSDEKRAADAAMRFGRLHNICGVCGADLTDLESRRLFLGPVCRQRFHL